MPAKLTTTDFIQRSKENHTIDYDYSEVMYSGIYNRVKIICPIHGEFEQVAEIHMNGSDCPKCAKTKMGKKIAVTQRRTKEEFEELASRVHNNKYDYSKSIYVNDKTKVCIICNIHGSFLQTPYDHLRGHGCKQCGVEKRAEKRKMKTAEFIKRADVIHEGFYTYEKTNYISSSNKVVVTCPIHGDFEIEANSHLQGKGCAKCGLEKTRQARVSNTDEFLSKAKILLSNKNYDYSLVDYKNNREKVKIICPVHGVFEVTPNNFLHGSGCPICKTSSLQEDAKSELKAAHIKFIPEKTFEWLMGERGHLMPIDIYLPDYNIGIECQGEQHFKPIEFFGGEDNFKKQMERDKKKYKLCKEHGINIYYLARQEHSEYFENVYTDMKELIRAIICSKVSSDDICVNIKIGGEFNDKNDD